MAAKKTQTLSNPSLFDYSPSTDIDFATSLDNISRQAMQMAMQENDDTTNTDDSDAAATQLQVKNSPYGPYQSYQQNASQMRQRRLYYGRRAYGHTLNDRLQAEPVQTTIPQYNPNQWTNESVRQFMPDTGGIVPQYVRMGQQIQDQKQAKELSTEKESGYQLNQLTPGLARYGITTVPMREMGVEPDPTLLRKRTGITASGGRGVT